MPKRIFKMTEEDYRDGVDSFAGFCLECGEQADGCEPDAAKYKCEACGARAVYGIENLLLMGNIELEV